MSATWAASPNRSAGHPTGLSPWSCRRDAGQLEGHRVAAVGQVLVLVALSKPYVETHSIRGVWLAVGVMTGVIELLGVGRRRAEATNKDRGSQIVLRVCTVPAAVVLVFSPTLLPAAEIRPPLVSAIVGIVLVAAGEALRVWSKATLGRYFTYTVMTSSDQPVITSGPYRLVRHPSYTGIMLIVLGVGAAWGNWLGLGVLTLMTFLGLRYRIYVEETALAQALGDRYRSYAEHHKRLIPFVW
jgi:protein-S-isoprenylcysteine O-methyltransferase Ste14